MSGERESIDALAVSLVMITAAVSVFVVLCGIAILAVAT